MLVAFLRKAFSHVADASSSEGLDINSTTPPSQYQMFKLVTNKRCVRAVKRVMEELNAAGFQLNSEVWLCYSLARIFCLTLVRLGSFAGDYGIDARETT